MLRRLIDWWRSGPPAGDAVDPLQTLDGLIADVERQGATFREGAATLLSLRAELRETLRKLQVQAVEVRARWQEVRDAADGERVAEVLAADLETLERRRAECELQLARADSDAELLLEGARAVQEELGRLKEERESTFHILTLDQTVTRALRARIQRMEANPALERARDEVARAQALAEIYREGG